MVGIRVRQGPEDSFPRIETTDGEKIEGVSSVHYEHLGDSPWGELVVTLPVGPGAKHEVDLTVDIRMDIELEEYDDEDE